MTNMVGINGSDPDGLVVLHQFFSCAMGRLVHIGLGSQPPWSFGFTPWLTDAWA